MKRLFAVPVVFETDEKTHRVTVRSAGVREPATHQLVWVRDCFGCYWVCDKLEEVPPQYQFPFDELHHAFRIGLLRIFGVPSDAQFMYGLVNTSPARLSESSRSHNGAEHIEVRCSVTGVAASEVTDEIIDFDFALPVEGQNVVRLDVFRYQRAHRVCNRR